MRLIDADKLEQIIKENIKDYEETDDPIRCDANKINLSTVRGMPTVDAEPVKHGRWIETKDPTRKRCSECDVIHLIAQYPHGNANYCPNCGARMNLRVVEKYINTADCKKYFYEHLDDNGITGALNAIEEMPAADVKPVKHGRWVHDGGGYDGRDNWYHCSECNRTLNLICGKKLENYPYCHCGAKMDLKDGESE